MKRQIIIQQAKKLLKYGKPVYGEIDNCRFRLIRIGTKYVTTIDGKILSIEGFKFYK